MKQLKLFAACCALSLLAAACGGAADDSAAPFTTQASALKQSGQSSKDSRPDKKDGHQGRGEDDDDHDGHHCEGHHGDDHDGHHGDDHDGHHGDDHDGHHCDGHDGDDHDGHGNHGDDHGGSGHHGDGHDDDGNCGGHDDNGTGLTITSAVKAITCTSTSGADVSLTGSITSSGSVDSADITVSIDGGAAKKLGVINPKDFVHNGRYKTAPYTVTVAVPNGDHSAKVCFVQSGAQGRTPKATCAPAVAVHVDCAPPPPPPPPVDVCAGVTPAGGIEGSGEVCTAEGLQYVPVLVNGSFGTAPVLTITGPNGFTFTATLTPSSTNPCAFEYDWAFASTAGAGDYTFTVTGNGHTYTFGAALTCTPPPPPPPVDVCPGVKPAGQVLGNTNICGSTDEFLPVHVQGNLGDAPTLTITSPNGSSTTVPLESTGTCAYQYSWYLWDIPGPGDYTLTAQGNGNTVTFGATIICKMPGPQT